MAQRYGIIGHPVAHSLSPAMQGAAFKALGMDAEYRTYDVEPSGLEAFLSGAAAEGIAGLNVTIPHKINAHHYIASHGELDTNAQRLGVVNTISVEASRLKGFNTDGPGFYRSLVDDLKFEPEGRSVFVLGAGGAAKAVVMYLGNGPKEIFVSDIDGAKAEGLKDHYKKYHDAKRLSIVRPSDIGGALEKCQLLVNATPVGMKETDGMPLDKRLLHPGLYVYDLVYNVPATALVKEATRMKLHAVTGIGMLLYQGAIAFEIWTGKKAPVGVMRRALREALKGS
jgi:shikimate dehydrogenase